MKSTVLRKDIAKFFAFGGDNEDPPRIKVPPEQPKPKPRNRRRDDDDDDDDDDDYSGPGGKDKRIYKLSQENKNRRRENNSLKDQLAEKDERIEELEGELRKAGKVQQALDKAKGDIDALNARVREQAIRSSVGKIKDKDGKDLVWYDEDMVLSLIDRKELSVDTNDFTVGGLEDQLRKIAEEKPFLVKESSGSGGNSQTRQPSGQAPQSSATGTQQQNNRNKEQEFSNRFAAMNNLV